MAQDGRGGYRAPRNPAPVSGPGALSRRTDKPLTGGGEYGESKQLAELQGGAPMQSSGGGSGAPEAPQPSPFIGMFTEPSMRPGEPVTAGADAGLGPDSTALGIPNEEDADIQAVLAYLPALEAAANRPNASPSTRAMIRKIKSRL